MPRLPFEPDKSYDTVEIPGEDRPKSPYQQAKAALAALNKRGETERVLRLLNKLVEMPEGRANYAAIFKQIDKPLVKR